MSALRGDAPQKGFILVRILCSAVLLILLAHAPRVFGQEQSSGSVQVASPPEEHAHSGAVASLQDLLTEAEQKNPQIQSARQTVRLASPPRVLTHTAESTSRYQLLKAYCSAT